MNCLLWRVTLQAVQPNKDGILNTGDFAVKRKTVESGKIQAGGYSEK